MNKFQKLVISRSRYCAFTGDSFYCSRRFVRRWLRSCASKGLSFSELVNLFSHDYPF